MAESICFRELFERVVRPCEVEDSVDYACVGVKWWGKGAFIREYKTGSLIRKKTQFKIEPGDVVYNKLFAWRGAFAIVEQDLAGCVVSDKFPTYRLRDSQVSLDYLRLLFQSPALAASAEKRSTGMAAMSKFTLNPPRFGELRVPLPSLERQLAIVDKWREADLELGKISNDASELNKLGKQLSSAAAHSLTQSFSAVPLRSIGKLTRRGIDLQDDVEYTQITIGMNNTGVRLRTRKMGMQIAVKNQSIVRAGDLVFSRIDLRNGAIGFVPSDLDGAVVGNDFPVFVVDAGVSTAYLNWCFRAPGFHRQCRSGSAGATNRRKITRDRFLSLTIPLPDLQTQLKVAAELDSLVIHANQIMARAVTVSRDIDVFRSRSLAGAFPTLE